MTYVDLEFTNYTSADEFEAAVDRILESMEIDYTTHRHKADEAGGWYEYSQQLQEEGADDFADWLEEAYDYHCDLLDQEQEYDD